MKYTQKQLEAMSDAELSRLMLINYTAKKFNADINGDIIIKKSRARASLVLFGTSVWHSFDINCWADMGPLLINNHISTHYLNIGKWIVYDELEQFSVKDEFNTPLRAAAIVYILINQGE